MSACLYAAAGLNRHLIQWLKANFRIRRIGLVYYGLVDTPNDGVSVRLRV